jgi:hypothetical protein
MANISIFAKPASRSRIDDHLLRGSSLVRGEQVASRLGAKLNPVSGYENDICIYVKPSAPSLHTGKVKLARYSYIDVIDSDNVLYFVRQNPNVGVIICSQVDYDRLSQELYNKVVFIPQHHCNFERIKRDKEEVVTVGVIGAPGLIARFPKDLEKRLAKVGMKLLKYSAFRSRQDVVDFYRKIDIQLVWRPWPMNLSNPLKIINAASFGIPTIAFEESVFSEVDDCYIPVKTLDELIDQTLQLKIAPSLYTMYKDRCLDKAEEYHIDRIVNIYKKLGEVFPPL